MKTSRRTRLVYSGEFAAKVDVDMIEEEGGWSPYLSVADAQKLDETREALKSRDLKKASSLGAVFKLIPLGS